MADNNKNYFCSVFMMSKIVLFFLFSLNITFSTSITIKPSNIVNLGVLSVQNQGRTPIFIHFCPVLNKCITGATANSTFDLYFGDQNATDLLQFADPENVTAAISLLDSAEEFYIHISDIFNNTDPGASCPGNPLCGTITNWLQHGHQDTTGLTRYNLIVLSDVCVNDDVFQLTYDNNTRYKFPSLTSTYNYFIFDNNQTCNNTKLYTPFHINDTSPRCADGDGLTYQLDNTHTAVNIFINVSSNNFDGAIDFLTNYVAETDYCSLSRSKNDSFTGLDPVYYVVAYVYNTSGFSFAETVIPWVSYNSSKYFKEYVKENIQYSIDLHRGTYMTPIATTIQDIYRNTLPDAVQFNVLYTDEFPAWLPNIPLFVNGRPLDVVLMLDDQVWDNETLIGLKMDIYNLQKDRLGFLLSQPQNSGGFNFYVLNSTDEFPIVPLCNKSILAASYTAVRIVKNYWYLWLLLPACLLVIGLCAARIVIVGDMKKHKTEFQEMVSKLQLSPTEAAVFRDARDKLYLETEFVVIDYEKILGKGSSSTVYEALLKGEAPLLRTTKTLETAKYHDCIVAAKISHQFGRDQVEALICEVDAGKRLGFHPNICTLLGWTMHQGSPCLFFETMDRDLLSYAQSLAPSQGDDETLAKSTDEETLIEQVFPTKLMLKIFWQTANALTYISSLKIIHRDVAARNILLNAGFVAKMSDFGLSCDPDETTALYKASFNKKLPIKWLALEAIVDRIFSEKTDVWAFGVTMIEAFTYGDHPYSDIGTGEIIEYLKSGNRLEKPDTMDDEIYKVVRSCWLEDPAERPTFEDLKTSLAQLLEKNNDSYGYLQFNEIDDYDGLDSIHEEGEKKENHAAREEHEAKEQNYDEEESLTTSF